MPGRTHSARLGQHPLSLTLESGPVRGEIGVPRFELGTSPTRTERATRLRHTPKPGHRVAPMLRAVLFDVDFTLARPGPELGPEGYVRAGERHGLRLEPGRYEAARDAALVDLRRHPEL